MCSLNGAAASSCDATEGDLAPVQGLNTLAVYAVGPGLVNDLTPAEYQWSVDDTRADARFIVTPATSTNSRNAPFEWTGSNATSFKCKINSQPEQQNCTSPQSYRLHQDDRGTEHLHRHGQQCVGAGSVRGCLQMDSGHVASGNGNGNLHTRRVSSRGMSRRGRADPQQNGHHQLQQRLGFDHRPRRVHARGAWAKPRIQALPVPEDLQGPSVGALQVQRQDVRFRRQPGNTGLPAGAGTWVPPSPSTLRQTPNGRNCLRQRRSGPSFRTAAAAGISAAPSPTPSGRRRSTTSSTSRRTSRSTQCGTRTWWATACAQWC